MIDEHINNKIIELIEPLENLKKWEFIIRIIVSYTGYYTPQGRIDYYKADFDKFVSAFDIKLEDKDEDIFTEKQLREMFGNRLDIWSAVKLCLGRLNQAGLSEKNPLTSDQTSSVRNLAISVAWE